MRPARPPCTISSLRLISLQRVLEMIGVVADVPRPVVSADASLDPLALLATESPPGMSGELALAAPTPLVLLTLRGRLMTRAPAFNARSHV